jgi:hypothetical protein
LLMTLPINAMDQRYRRSGFTAVSAVEWAMGVMIGTGAVESVWKEEYYKPAQEAKQKVPETTDSEPPRKKHFTFRY